MTYIGNFALLIALVVTGYSILASIIGIRWKRNELVKSAMNATIGMSGLLTVSIAALLYAFITNDFELAYVADYSSRNLPLVYTLSALWGGQAGSLLFWAWLLGVCMTVVVIQNRRQNISLLPYVNIILAVVQLFFLILLSSVSSPFTRLDVVPLDGQGLNPLLQNPGMLFHPPTLLIGYVGFTIPFAFAIAALITRRLDDSWIRSTRRWTIFSWFFLGVGIFLGAKWAYVELGWGGYWAWDPVENASLMPWLTGTAYLHSVMIQERKNMLKVWNIVLIILTFLLCLFGTFITRSGIISSVHSFGRSALGPLFLTFILLALVISVFLVVIRYSFLKSTNELDSLVSRESSFLFNNLILVGATFAVFLGTMFPIISEAVTGAKITVGPPFFNKIIVPIALALLLVTGICPLIPWRKATWSNFRRNLLTPLVVALIGGTGLFLAGIRHGFALLTFTIAFFVTATIVLEFINGVNARRSLKSERFFTALVRLIWRNKRRYGGYVVHFGMVLIFVGITGSSAFRTSKEIHLKKGETTTLRNYSVTFEALTQFPTENKEVTSATLSLEKDGKWIGYVSPSIDTYNHGTVQNASEVAIKSTLKEDFYVILAGYETNEIAATFKLIINPLVIWIWIGGAVMAAGTFLVMLPDRRDRKRMRIKYTREAIKK